MNLAPSVQKETRNEDETWCIYETSFDSLDALKTIYSMTDTQINDISLANGMLTYDISLDLGGDSSVPMGAEIAWIVKMPGTITETNATQQDGNILTWTLAGGQTNNIRAVSEIGGFNFESGNLMYILGGMVLLCLCCFVPIAIGAAAFFLLRKKKNAETPES